MARLTDKERILMKILARIAPRYAIDRSDRFERSVDIRYDRVITPGMLVIPSTSAYRPERWGIAIVEEVIDQHHLILREIGSNDTCDFCNETFYPVEGLSETDLYAGDDRRTYERVMQAARLVREQSKNRCADWHIVANVHITTDAIDVRVRPHMLLDLDRDKDDYTISFARTAKMTVKDIAKCLRDGGYTTRDFPK